MPESLGRARRQSNVQSRHEDHKLLSADPSRVLYPLLGLLLSPAIAAAARALSSVRGWVGGASCSAPVPKFCRSGRVYLIR
jgi:hypothetical protein